MKAETLQYDTSLFNWMLKIASARNAASQYKAHIKGKKIIASTHVFFYI